MKTSDSAIAVFQAVPLKFGETALGEGIGEKDGWTVALQGAWVVNEGLLENYLKYESTIVVDYLILTVSRRSRKQILQFSATLHSMSRSC